MSKKVIIDYNEYQELIEIKQCFQKNKTWYYDGYTKMVIGEETEALNVLKTECEILQERSKFFSNQIYNLPMWVKKMFNVTPYFTP